MPRCRGMCSVELGALELCGMQIYGIKSHRSPSYVVPSLAEHRGDEMYGASMYAARWKVYLPCLQTDKPPYDASDTCLTYKLPFDDSVSSYIVWLRPQLSSSPEGRSPVCVQGVSIDFFLATAKPID